jgi:hypothetical protein
MPPRLQCRVLRGHHDVEATQLAANCAASAGDM